MLLDMDPIFRRQLQRLDYVAPEQLLRGGEDLVTAILQGSETVRHLSHRERNTALEKHQAGFLGLLMKRQSESQGVEVEVAYSQIADYDCVVRALGAGREPAYKLIQLKQLPAEEVSPDASLQQIIDAAGRYQDPENLVLGIWINRNIRLRFEDLDFRGLRVEQVYLFGDAITGELTLDGGQVSDLLLGRRWGCRLHGMVADTELVQFTPLNE
jgi:hypothetical protein